MHYLKTIIMFTLILGSPINPVQAQTADDALLSCPAGYMPQLTSHPYGCVLSPQAATTEHLSVGNAAKQTSSVHTSPNAAPIGTGGMILGNIKMGCYADHSKDGKVQLIPFVGDKTGEWIADDHYGTKEIVSKIDVYMVCTTSTNGLTVMLAAEGFEPAFFSAKWNE